MAIITHIVLFLDQLNDVGRIVGEDTVRSSLDVMTQLLVDSDLFFGDGENQIDRVLLDFLVDLRNRRIILRSRVRVPARAVQMAIAVIGFHYSSQLETSKS